MFNLAFFLGAYSYAIFLFGIVGLLYLDLIVWFTVFYWGAIATLKLRRIKGIKWIKKVRFKKNKFFLLLLALFVLQSIVNLIGALGPELAFDALWYHLTLPKLYLQNHSIFFIPGGLFYYSAMPKLGEMLYIGGLSFGSEMIPKLIHFSFGLLTCLATYKLSRKFFTPLVSMIAVVIFYSNLVVGWQSITAYIDLIRSFFEIMALWAFINWLKKRKTKLLIWSALMLGFAITTKLLAIASLIIFTLLILSQIRNVKAIKEVVIFVLVALTVPLPWLIFSYVNTGNPVYPFFSGIYKIMPEPLNIFGFIKEIWILFAQSADPISPIYIIFLPLFIFLWKVLRKVKGFKEIGIYSILATIIWYFTPRTGGGRFILPYLPALSILCTFCLNEILKNVRIRFLGNFLIFTIIFISVISIGYRFIANTKYIPVIFAKETKKEFLENHLNFSFGDFYDIDGYFENHIKPDDKVLLYGFHNLYYVDFPFIDSSWLKKADKYNYIATQNINLPDEYKDWKLIYENERTMVKLYKP